MNTNDYFSLETALGTARAVVYWRDLPYDRKTDILLSLQGRRAPDPQLLELVLAEGNPLHIELASIYPSGRRSRMCDDLEPYHRAAEFTGRIWRERMGFWPGDVEAMPLGLASDFYLWLRGDSVDGPCAELQAWADWFYSRGQFEQKVIIEVGSQLPFWAAVGVLTVGVHQRKLMCWDAANLFATAVNASYNENSGGAKPYWKVGLTYDYAVVIAAFLNAIAIEDRCNENDDEESMFSPLSKAIQNLPELIVSDESVEPLLNIHSRALSMLVRCVNREKRRHDLAVLIKRISIANQQTYGTSICDVPLFLRRNPD